MIKIPKKVYLHPDADDDILEVLNALPHSEMSGFIAEALREKIERNNAGTPAQAQLGIDQGQLGAFKREILADLRQMIEAVIDAKLAGLVVKRIESPAEVPKKRDVMAELDPDALM